MLRLSQIGSDRAFTTHLESSLVYPSSRTLTTNDDWSFWLLHWQTSKLELDQVVQIYR